MGEGCQGPTENKNQGSATAAGLGYSKTVILNISRHGKSQPYHGRIHNSVDYAIKLVFLPKEKDKQNQSLRGLFHDRSRYDAPNVSPALASLVSSITITE